MRGFGVHGRKRVDSASPQQVQSINPSSYIAISPYSIEKQLSKNNSREATIEARGIGWCGGGLPFVVLGVVLLVGVLPSPVQNPIPKMLIASLSYIYISFLCMGLYVIMHFN